MKCPRCQHENPSQARFCMACGARLGLRAKPATPKRSVSRKAHKNEGAGVHDLEKRLTEALDQQTATAEILRVIRSSPTELQPVLDAVAESAARLCTAYDASIFRLDGAVLRLVAHHGSIPNPPRLAIRATRGTVNGRAVLDQQTVHVADLLAEAGEFPEGSTFARELGFRSLVCVPLVREGVAIGTIGLRRTEVQPFTDKQITLLQTFADQAVIAIENVRLFTELQASNRELTTALDTQTATSDILRVISRSPTDVRPVFDAIVANAVRLCGAVYGIVWRYDRDMVYVAGVHNFPPEELDGLRRQHPRSLADDDLHETIRSGRLVDIADIEATEMGSSVKPHWRRRGVRSVLMVPMHHQGEVVDAIGVSHREVGAFSPSRIDLLKTFADQAVIAIENVRLFTELQEKNRALTQANAQVTESLEQQTATSEVLRVIAAAQTNAQPVFDTIATSALRLCTASNCAVFRFDGERIHIVALQNVNPEGTDAARQAFPMPPSRGGSTARAILTRDVVNIPDVREDTEYQLQGMAAAVGFRSVLSVPMLREGNPIGAISVLGVGVAAFSDNHVELLKTFADQAVIAIENVRLFTEFAGEESCVD
jgi:two-component system, NtrC family, sensor kinase